MCSSISACFPVLESLFYEVLEWLRLWWIATGIERSIGSVTCLMSGGENWYNDIVSMLEIGFKFMQKGGMTSQVSVTLTTQYAAPDS